MAPMLGKPWRSRVEAELSYQYENCKMPGRNFHLRLWLRLSESTDIVGAAVKCLQQQFMLAAECAFGELTLLPDLHVISLSYGAPWLGIQDSYTRLTRICLPDPTCCKSNGHESCPNNTHYYIFSLLSRFQTGFCPGFVPGGRTGTKGA